MSKNQSIYAECAECAKPLPHSELTCWLNKNRWQYEYGTGEQFDFLTSQQIYELAVAIEKSIDPKEEI